MTPKINSAVTSKFVAPLLLILLLSVIYTQTLLPGVGFTGDTAKLQYVGYVLGTPHPTGYPTYVVMNHFFTRLFPYGSIAYRANLLSAVFAVAACLFLYHLLLLLGFRRFLSFVAALTFGLTFTLWSQAVIAEVYTLNSLFVSAVLYFFIKWHLTKSQKYLIAGCAAFALSLGNHLTIVTFLPALFYFVYATDREIFRRPRILIMISLLVIAGALQYLYIFWRTADPSTKFLEMKAPDFNTFFWYITGGRFKRRMFPFSVSQFFLERIPMYLRLLFREYHILIPLGIYGFFKVEDRKLNLFLILGFLGNLLYALNYRIPDIYVYFIPGYFILAIYITYGLSAALSFVSRRTVLQALLLSVIPILFFALNYPKVNKHDGDPDAEEIKTTLATIKSNAIIVPHGYKEAQFFYYYLIGENQMVNKIYVLKKSSPEEIKDYLAKRKSMFVAELKRKVPYNLTVYCYGEKPLKSLSESGLRLRWVRKRLYEVSL